VNRLRTLAALTVLAVPMSVVATGCGGEESEEDPQQVLQATFAEHDTEVTSGVIELSLEASAGEQGSLSATLSGPFQTDPEDPNALPQLDLSLDVSGEGTGESVDFSGGLVITEDSAFVEYDDTAYEAPQVIFDEVATSFEQSAAQDEAESAQSFTESCERAVEQSGGDVGACDIDFSSWLTDLTNEGTEDVEGTETVHVHGDANVEQILSDVTGIVAEAAPAGSEKALDLDQLEALAPAISEAAIDVYSGEEDDIVRRLSFAGALDPGAASGLPLPPIDLSLSATLSELNEEQTIEAPADARSLQDLLDEHGIDLSLAGGLSGLDDLQGLGDGEPRPERPERERPDDDADADDAVPDDDGGDSGTGSGDDGAVPDDDGGDSGTGDDDTGTGDGGAGSIFGNAPGLSRQEQRVLDCISQATNVDELEQCNDLLEQ
jgi:hypothetical protein